MHKDAASDQCLSFAEPGPSSPAKQPKVKSESMPEVKAEQSQPASNQAEHVRQSPERASNAASLNPDENVKSPAPPGQKALNDTAGKPPVYSAALASLLFFQNWTSCVVVHFTHFQSVYFQRLCFHFKAKHAPSCAASDFFSKVQFRWRLILVCPCPCQQRW